MVQNILERIADNHRKIFISLVTSITDLVPEPVKKLMFIGENTWIDYFESSLDILYSHYKKSINDDSYLNECKDQLVTIINLIHIDGDGSNISMVMNNKHINNTSEWHTEKDMLFHRNFRTPETPQNVFATCSDILNNHPHDINKVIVHNLQYSELPSKLPENIDKTKLLKIAIYLKFLNCYRNEFMFFFDYLKICSEPTTTANCDKLFPEIFFYKDIHCNLKVLSSIIIFNFLSPDIPALPYPSTLSEESDDNWPKNFDIILDHEGVYVLE
jgi:hypothetical protein